MSFQALLCVLLRVFAEIGDIPGDLVVSSPEITEEEWIGEGTGREGKHFEENRRSRRKYGAVRWKRK